MVNKDDEGLALDEYFDFELTNSQDIRTTSGIEKLITDLSHRLSNAIGGEIGAITSREMAIDTTARAQSVILNDDRILSADNARLIPTDDRDRIVLEYTVTSIFGQFTNEEELEA